MTVDLQVEAEELTKALQHGPIDVFVAHRSLLFAEALCGIIAKEHDLRVVGHASDAVSVRSFVGATPACIVLLDADLAIDATDLLTLGTSEGGVKMVLIARVPDDRLIVHALQYGIRGVILESMGARLLVNCIRKVFAGKEWIEQASAQRLLQRYVEQTRADVAGMLSRREIQVVRGIARGLTNREIGRELFINPATVKSHVHNVFRKLNVTSRVAVNNFAREHGLI